MLLRRALHYTQGMGRHIDNEENEFIFYLLAPIKYGILSTITLLAFLANLNAA